MKKTIFFISLVLLLCYCAELTQTANLTTAPKSKRSLDCTSVYPVRRFEVFQVIEDNYALAHGCNADDDTHCWGTLVLLTPMSGIDFYDDMFVTIPKEKCAVQNGVYRYETRYHSIKTVPRIEYGCEFVPETEEEFIRRLDEKADQLKICVRLQLKAKKYNTITNLKKCDCWADFLVQEVKENIKTIYTDEVALKKAIEQKCGKLPVDVW